MIPGRFAPALFGLILSGLMSLLVSGISTLRAAGPAPGFVAIWLSAWLTAWLIAFPVVLVVAPLTRRFLGRVVTDAQPLLPGALPTGDRSRAPRVRAGGTARRGSPGRVQPRSTPTGNPAANEPRSR